MKIRMDYVTNSSSSSFILARNSELNEQQKEEIIRYVKNNFWGRQVLSPESTEEEILETFEDCWVFHNEDIQQKVRAALRDGKSICIDLVNYDECEYSYASVFTDIWEIVKENGKDSLIEIDGDLSY